MPSQSTPSKDLWRIRHMIEYANLTLHIAEGKSANDLADDIQASLSLVKLFEIIGEAARHISGEVKLMAPDIPWENIVGTRNRLIHEYFDIDYAILAKTVEEDIPLLLPKLLELEARLTTQG